MRRDQVDSRLTGLREVPAQEYNDLVPRYFCPSCGVCLVGDCTPVGFGMVIVPTERICSTLEIPSPQYHMHVGEGIAAPANDGLPRYDANPEGAHMDELVQGCS